MLTQVGKVQQLLVPCFALPDEPRVRERLGALLELVTRRYRATSPPPSFLASGFYQRLKEARQSHLIVFIRIRLDDWLVSRPIEESKLSSVLHVSRRPSLVPVLRVSRRPPTWRRRVVGRGGVERSAKTESVLASLTGSESHNKCHCEK